ncbi:hypothetical protein RF11_06691 [Thelohanellus kitauei]|uniref:Uncharacterized protein n=1 Tax=Thelohanellus kitauei TaxID=669202 RepID=A0A0C2JAV8_THEKT|nr:hypothetical protein RF11_06691 [Thelohanellus kitauei]
MICSINGCTIGYHPLETSISPPIKTLFMKRKTTKQDVLAQPVWRRTFWRRGFGARTFWRKKVYRNYALSTAPLVIMVCAIGVVEDLLAPSFEGIKYGGKCFIVV